MNFYVVGSNPSLSLAEFSAIYPSARVQTAFGSIVLAETGGPAPEEAVKRLAGIVKAGHVSEARPKGSGVDSLPELLLPLLDLSRPGKVEFGLSAYDAGNPALYGQLKGHAMKIGLEVKRLLKEQGRGARLVTTKDEALSSVAVTTQAHAGELVLIATKDGILVGRTDAVQDFRAWEERDFGRPARDARSGMLPPKLARTLANLAIGDAPPSALMLLDPFCGSGTVLMEAALMGCKAVIGSDISKKAVGDTGKNMEWLRGRFADAKATRVSVYECDAKDLARHVTSPVDAIATETYLGVPLKREATKAQAEKAVSDLMKTYLPSALAMKAVLKPGGRIAMAFPAFRVGKDLVKVPVEFLCEKTGLALEDRYLYERVGQRVAREIVVMKKA